mmetsp:Transcript_21573/g.54459  ORF Transcript_21573/g.54459 Transcript_21573/m.54459 type:complete len:311 (-) Transcript_21573:1420-2352(-)|eukprot:CAMPEP_0178998396 /NCGR_PEP_ID=MMETSP0795-20121207/9490_1 /TAXON_ID=88552 /ORGANISM="Amoebophrya sp., Strain Ameob2" /LENGTH=310 /DNA_ID=CAMNT_0020691071 /DNA_START=268 /DNA_END=1200 /DNA_ORIENTATION=+
MDLHFANAPISWGINEFGIESSMKPDQMLDELKLAGYSGTELGDYGFFPTTDAELEQMIKSRGLDMIGAFVTYALWDKSKHEEGRAYARKVAHQLKQFAGKQAYPPHIVLADNVSDPERIKHTSRITRKMSLVGTEKWRVLCEEVKYLMNMLETEYGIKAHFHPHCGSYIETPFEIEQLVKDVPGLKLIYDTAHVTMGAGNPLACIEFLRRYPDRIHSFHFKDYDGNATGKDYFELVNNGCFPELGRGMVDFEGVKQWQIDNAFKGWIVVEQDLLGDAKSNPLQSAVSNMAYLKKLYKDEIAGRARKAKL